MTAPHITMKSIALFLLLIWPAYSYAEDLNGVGMDLCGMGSLNVESKSAKSLLKHGTRGLRVPLFVGIVVE